MKQLLLLLVLIGFSAVSKAQNNLVPLLSDSSHYYYYDANSGALQFSTKSYETYNDDDLLLISYNHNTFSGMTTYYKNEYDYNASNQNTRYTTLKSDVSANGPWSNFLREDFTYDAQGRNNYFFGQFGNAQGDWENYYQQTTWFDDAEPSDSSLYQLWNSGTGAWGNYRRHFNEYYPDGLQESALDQEWLNASSTWRNLEQEFFTYYPDQSPKTHVSISTFSSGNMYVLRDSFVYRADGLLDTTHVVTQLLPSGNANYLYRKNKYDPNGNLARQDSYIRSGNTWTPSSRFTYEPADGVYSNDPAYVLSESYDEVSQTYYPLWSIDRQYTPLANDVVLYVEVNTQRDGQNQLVPQSVDSVWYHAVMVGTNTPLVRTQADCDFANPFTPGSSIVCHAEAPDPLTVQLRNMFGQLVLQTRVMPGESWRPAMELPSGSYALSVWQQGHYLGVRKMMVR